MLILNFIIAIIGAVIGGLFVLIGTFIGLRYDSKKEQKKEKRLVDSFKKAIYYEINSLWNLPSAKEIINKLKSIEAESKYLSNEINKIRDDIIKFNKNSPENPYNPEIQDYINKMQNTLESPEQTFYSYFYFTQNYFPIYERNANLIGLIDDKEITELIVITYIEIKSLIELLRINNDILKKFEFYKERFILNPNLKQFNVFQMLNLMLLLRNNAVILKSALDSANEKVESLLKRLSN